MKKIISALTISALALGSVFADISLAYTQKGIITKSNGSDTSSKLDLNGYKAKVTDDVVFSLSNDLAGVVVDVDPYYEEAGRVNMANNTSFFDQYYGWVKFFDGSMKLQSGVWGSRSVNRMNKDAGKWESAEYERYKPGIIGGLLGSDISRTAAFNGNTALSTALTYSSDLFTVTAVAISNDYKTNTGTVTTETTKSGFGAEVAVNLDENTKIQAILKSPFDQSIAFAAFVDKKNFDIKGQSIDFLAGATFAQGAYNTSTYSDSSSYEFGADFRARYELNDKVAVTTMNNLSYLGWASTSGTKNARYYILWDMVSLACMVSDNLKVMATLEWEYNDLFAENKGVLELIPSVTYIVGPGADISAGIILNTNQWPNPTTASISVPFILHVAL